jgi:hypothetical protein
MRYCGYYAGQFGEVNEDNSLHGRGINISFIGTITIGYFENGDRSTGNYIWIYRNGNFDVGECYMKDGVRWIRGTTYYTAGGKFKYDKEW